MEQVLIIEKICEKGQGNEHLAISLKEPLNILMNTYLNYLLNCNLNSDLDQLFVTTVLNVPLFSHRH